MIPTPDTMPARCNTCGAVEQVPLADVDPDERHLSMIETCCDACLDQIMQELAEEPPRCLDCNQLIPDEGDGLERIRCATCAELRYADAAPIPQESDPNPFLKGVALFALLLAFLALTSHPASARDYRDVDTRVYDPSRVYLIAYLNATTPPPAGCIITRAFEDMSALAECADGATYAYDPDGNGMAGLSYNPGGQWHDIS